jgi:acetylornithine/succinyldiaminopimelate/putrescine aminotransferase
MLGVLGLTDNLGRRDAHRPLLPGIAHIPLGDLPSLREALRWKDVAALVVEPIQEEASYGHSVGAAASGWCVRFIGGGSYGANG